MPRRKMNPDVPAFDFQRNPDKPDLKQITLTSYKSKLQSITELSHFEHERDESKPLILNKEDLLNHSEYVVNLIKQHNTKRLVFCAIYSAIFYAIGRQDFEKDARGKIYTDEFRKAYYTQDYQPTKIESVAAADVIKLD